MRALGRCAEVAIEVADVQAGGQQAVTQPAQVAFDQAGGVRPLCPELAAEAALDQLRLNLQRPQRLHGEGQFHTPQLLLGFAFFATFLGLFFFG
ncbi:hypothetical protein D3C84_1088790 [compost metagenome]